MSVKENWIPVVDVTPAMKNICLEVKQGIEAMASSSFDVYTPISFTYKIITDVINYAVKVNVGKDVYTHAMISQTLPCYGGELNVLKVKHPVASSEPLKPF